MEPVTPCSAADSDRLGKLTIECPFANEKRERQNRKTSRQSPELADTPDLVGLDDESKKSDKQIVIVLVAINPNLAMAGNSGQMLPRAFTPFFKRG
jgi:hypothetical protein